MARASPEQSKAGAGSRVGLCTLSREEGLLSRCCLWQQCGLWVALGVIFPRMHWVAHESWEKLLKKESCSQGWLKKAAFSSNTRLQIQNAC